METHNIDQPSSEEARQALASANAEEDATINQPVPAWYFPVLAVGAYPMFALQAIDEPSPAARAVIIVSILVLGMGLAFFAARFGFNRPGYQGIRPQWRSGVLAMVVAAAFPITATILANTVGSWVWLVIGAAFTLMVLVVGEKYRWKHRA